LPQLPQLFQLPQLLQLLQEQRQFEAAAVRSAAWAAVLASAD